MQEFDIEINYRPGKANQNADCLSRIPVNKSDDQPVLEEPVPIFFITRDFAAEQNKDCYCMSARKQFENATQRHKAVKEDQIDTDNKKTKELLIPPTDKQADQLNQSEDDSDDDCLDFVEFHNGLIGTADGKILVPKTLRSKILQRFHDSPYAGHLGTRKTIARIKRRCQKNDQGCQKKLKTTFREKEQLTDKLTRLGYRTLGKRSNQIA